MCQPLTGNKGVEEQDCVYVSHVCMCVHVMCECVMSGVWLSDGASRSQRELFPGPPLPLSTLHYPKNQPVPPAEPVSPGVNCHAGGENCGCGGSLHLNKKCPHLPPFPLHPSFKLQLIPGAML